MTIRNTTATLLFSTLMLASGSALAAQQSVGGASFESQLGQAASALSVQNSGAVGREEILGAAQNLQIARDLQRQGQGSQAQGYLNAARGTLGLVVGPSAPELAGSSDAAFSGSAKAAEGPSLAFSKDFFNMHGH